MKLEPKNLTKKYDLDTLGIEDVSFAVFSGERHVLYAERVFRR